MFNVVTEMHTAIIDLERPLRMTNVIRTQDIKTGYSNFFLYTQIKCHGFTGFLDKKKW